MESRVSTHRKVLPVSRARLLRVTGKVQLLSAVELLGTDLWWLTRLAVERNPGPEDTGQILEPL